MKTMKWSAIAVVLLGLGLVQTPAQTDYRNVPVVKGIVFIKSLDDLKPDGVPAMTGYVARDLPLLQKPAFKTVVEPYLGKPLNAERMRELQKAVILYYREHDLPIVDVIYRDQDVSNGVLQVIVLEGKLGKKKVEHYRYSYSSTNFWVKQADGWTKTAYAQDNIRLRPGEVIRQDKLRSDLDFLSRNPLRDISVYFQPSEDKVVGDSDVLLRINEQRPYQFTVGYEDTGTRITDINRIFAGLTWANPFGLNDHLLNFQYLGDPSFEHLWAYSGGYNIALPWHHYLRMFGYYMDSSGTVSSNTTLKGVNYQASFRYDIPLPYLGKYQHEVSFGLDYKYANNFLVYGAPQANETPVEIFQFALTYSGALRDPYGASIVVGQLFYSPGGVTSLNNDKAFSQAQFDAKADYVYGKLVAKRETMLKFLPWTYVKGQESYFSWILNGTAQFANGNLLPSEQLGLGGYLSVRGYDDRIVNTDQGYLFSTELRTPAVRPLADWCGWGWADDSFQFLPFFYDLGYGYNVHPLPGSQTSQLLSSMGCGLRYVARKNLEVRFDYGWQLNKLDPKLEPITSRAHVGVSLKF
jgi:hemolysin activation/secretion protein